jgi:hypothetical protein
MKTNKTNLDSRSSYSTKVGYSMSVLSATGLGIVPVPLNRGDGGSFEAGFGVTLAHRIPVAPGAEDEVQFLGLAPFSKTLRQGSQGGLLQRASVLQSVQPCAVSLRALPLQQRSLRRYTANSSCPRLTGDQHPLQPGTPVSSSQKFITMPQCSKGQVRSTRQSRPSPTRPLKMMVSAGQLKQPPGAPAAVMGRRSITKTIRCQSVAPAGSPFSKFCSPATWRSGASQEQMCVTSWEQRLLNYRLNTTNSLNARTLQKEASL